MTEHGEASQPDLDEVLEAFLESHRRGEAPSIEGYADAHPGLADEIREVFPALLMMEASELVMRETAMTAAVTMAAEITKDVMPVQLLFLRLTTHFTYKGASHMHCRNSVRQQTNDRNFRV